MFHSFAATVGMLTPLLHGLSFVPLPRFEPGLVSDAIHATRATVFLGVPSMYNLLLRLPDEQLSRWRSIRVAISGGAAIPVELMRRFEARFGVPVLEGDGPTECSPVTCVNPAARYPEAGIRRSFRARRRDRGIRRRRLPAGPRRRWRDLCAAA